MYSVQCSSDECKPNWQLTASQFRNLLKARTRAPTVDARRPSPMSEKLPVFSPRSLPMGVIINVAARISTYRLRSVSSATLPAVGPRPWAIRNFAAYLLGTDWAASKNVSWLCTAAVAFF